MAKIKITIGYLIGLALTWQFVDYQRVTSQQALASAATADTLAGRDSETSGSSLGRFAGHSVSTLVNAIENAEPDRLGVQDDHSLYSSFAETPDYYQFAQTYRAAAESGDRDAQYLVAKTMIDCVGMHGRYRPADEEVDHLLIVI